VHNIGYANANYSHLGSEELTLLKINRIGIFVVIILSLILSACGRNNTHFQEKSINEENQKISDNYENTENDLIIVTSFYPIYVFTKNIAHDIPGVKVINMTEPQTGCLHDYQLVPADMKTLEKADIFVINGAGMESFLDKVMSQLPDLRIIEASLGIPLLKDDNGEENPHVWVSISGAINEVHNIAEGLAALDSKNSAKYIENSEEYVKRLEALKDKMHDALKDMNIVSVVEREPGSEPSAGELAATIKAINDSRVKVLFAEPQYSTKAAEAIASETGAKVYILDPVVTGPKDAAPDSYEKTMEENLKVLVEALYD
jgi:zinc transport system substrate-binding protein